MSFKLKWFILILIFLFLVFPSKNSLLIGEGFQLESLEGNDKISLSENDKPKKPDQNKCKYLFLLVEITKNDKPDFFQNLFDSGFEVNACNKNGQSLLMLVIKNNLDADIIQFLIEAGAEVNAQDQDGKTPLMYAAEHSINLNGILILLEAGADKCISDKDGKRAFDYLQKSPMILQANENYPVACQLLDINLNGR